jgi:hypothetical protein
MTTKTLALVPLSFALSLFAAPGARSQEEPPIEEELTKLFRQIREDLREIDRLLLEAGGEGEAARRAAGAVEGMRRLLEDTRTKQRAVVEGIDEVLRKAPT